jgi:hypothetical protein
VVQQQQGVVEEENVGVENEAEAEVEEKLARLRQC